MGNAELGGLCIGLVVAIVVFFITRELWCWYFKLTGMLDELYAIRVLLTEINERGKPKPGAYGGEFAPHDVSTTRRG